MAVLPLASVDDLEARMGRSVDDRAQAEALLGDASALIRSEASPEDWVDDEGALEAVPPIVVAVCCKVVQRILTNPDGMTSEAIAGYSAGFSNSSIDAYLTKAERRLIRKAAGVQMIGSVEMETPYRRVSTDIYLPVDNGGEELPMGPWPT